MKVAFLGAGAMGSRMASRLIEAGHSLRVYNRTSENIHNKIKGDFQYCGTPAEAAKDAEIIFSMVTDDEASKIVWLDPKIGALGSANKKALLVECSTVSAGWMIELGKAATQKGYEFLDAPVLGSLPQAELGQLIFTIGGDTKTLQKAQDILKILGSKVVHVGEIGSGTAVKLAANTYFAAQLVGLKSALEIAKKENVSAQSLLGLFSEIPAMSPAMKGVCGLILANDTKPRFTSELIAKDLRYARKLITKSQANLVTTLEQQFNETISAGFGKENITAIYKNLIQR